MSPNPQTFAQDFSEEELRAVWAIHTAARPWGRCAWRDDRGKVARSFVVVPRDGITGFEFLRRTAKANDPIIGKSSQIQHMRCACGWRIVVLL
jgi:hypothetical protein